MTTIAKEQAILEIHDENLDALESLYQDLKRMADDARVRVVVARSARNRVADAIKSGVSHGRAKASR